MATYGPDVGQPSEDRSPGQIAAPCAVPGHRRQGGRETWNEIGVVFMDIGEKLLVDEWRMRRPDFGQSQLVDRPAGSLRFHRRYGDAHRHRHRRHARRMPDRAPIAA